MLVHHGIGHSFYVEVLLLNEGHIRGVSLRMNRLNLFIQSCKSSFIICDPTWGLFYLLLVLLGVRCFLSALVLESND
jgi:hypothetical protein